MTNPCYNKIEVEGDETERMRMVSFIHGDKDNVEFDFNKVLPYPEEYAKMDAESPIHHPLGYNSGGYEWCIANWGTKWNASEVYVKDDGSEITFDTGWTPSLPVTLALSKLFPTLIFTHRYEESGCNFSGYAIFRDGQEIESAEGEFNDYIANDYDDSDEYE